MSREDGAVCQQGESVQLLDIEVAPAKPQLSRQLRTQFPTR
jgi:hypothetical protein